VRFNELRPGITVSDLCIGGGPLGGWPEVYGYEVDEAQSIAAVEAVFASPINFMDTSSEYGNGESEKRIGKVIKSGGMPKGFVLSTKADSAGGDYSGRRVRASFEQSLERLGVDHIDLYYLHNPEKLPFEEVMGPSGAVEELVRLKDEGLVSAIGIAGGDVDENVRYVDTGYLDVLMCDSQFNLLDRKADSLISRAVAKGVTFVNAAPYASGMLAAYKERKPTYQYAAPDAEAVRARDQLRELCDSYGVDLRAVALQFSTRDPRVTSTAVGISRPERVQALLDNASAEIPDELWDRLPEPLNRENAQIVEWRLGRG
jgi:D-threo-aldose 1-dehydrogenase